MAVIELTSKERAHLTHQIQEHVREELDHEIGNMEAGLLLDRLSEVLGATLYNKGLRDAAALFARRADDIADEFYALEKPDTLR